VPCQPVSSNAVASDATQKLPYPLVTCQDDQRTKRRLRSQRMDAPTRVPSRLHIKMPLPPHARTHERKTSADQYHPQEHNNRYQKWRTRVLRTGSPCWLFPSRFRLPPLGLPATLRLVPLDSNELCALALPPPPPLPPDPCSIWKLTACSTLHPKACSANGGRITTRTKQDQKRFNPTTSRPYTVKPHSRTLR
jgi:hypothetical protein